jgi:hypothetical protein
MMHGIGSLVSEIEAGGVPREEKLKDCTCVQ